MNKYHYDEKPVRVTKDSGYSKVELLSPENRRKARERVKDPNYVNVKYKLKEFFAEIGIVVIPEKMTMWYLFNE